MMEKIFTISSRDEGNIEDLVGKVININNIEGESDYGDCCGFADVDELKNTFEGNVLITNVEIDGGDTSNYPNNSIKVTFYGANKQIYQANLSDGSGSGWDYGAVATLTVILDDKT